jgi:hypothetical protein
VESCAGPSMVFLRILLKVLSGLTRGGEEEDADKLEIQDLCNTVDMPSTCGSFALKQGKPKANAKLFDTLVAAGLIGIAKSTSAYVFCPSSTCLMHGTDSE